MNKILFSHEKLNVYKKSLVFVKWVSDEVLDKIEKKYSVHDQLERASTSIPLNIAEGNGKYTSKDRCRFFDIARGSALECSAALDIVVCKGLIKYEEVLSGKKILHEMVSMLVGLIKSNSDRVYEDEVGYKIDNK